MPSHRPLDLTTITILLCKVLRECAILHGQNAAILAAFGELQISHPELDGLHLDQVQKDAEQKFLELIERIHPGIAAIIDDRAIGDI